MSPPKKKSASKKAVSKKAVRKKAASKKKVSRKKVAKKAVSRKKTAKKAPSAQRPRSWLRRSFPVLSLLLVIAVIAATLWTVYLDHNIRQQFEGKRWALPARVYAQSLELYPGKAVNLTALYKELEVANYRRSAQVTQPGTFRQLGQRIRIYTRDFQYWDEFVPGGLYELILDTGTVRQISHQGQAVSLLRIDPAQVAAIYPNHNEDRDLVPYADIPETLIKSLLLIEDRQFYKHHGVRPMAIARAMLVNLKAGRAVQGGSTLTQQLVKNYFLTRERSISRKLVEAWMAVLLELHYEKNDILEAYVNEVFLGQDGERAIHGFGLAARYYFDQPITALSIDQQALLVAMVKGATYYNPRRHPKRAKQRRDLVLDQLAEHGVISSAEALRAKQRPLGVVLKPTSFRNRYLAYTDLVKQQLKRDYEEADLRTEGLRIFTALSPGAQYLLELSINRHITQLEQRSDIAEQALQAAAIVTDTRTGEVIALAGGRDAKDSGFNRALDIRRQIGSLVKPAVYLTALRDSSRYTPATLLDDTRFDHVDEQFNIWSPTNYSGHEYGAVPLYQSLINSYNISTARLGLALGVPQVSQTLRSMGLAGEWEDYPSLLLGALESSPYQVAQLYQTFATDGFYTPLRSVREVVTANGERLQRYAFELEQRESPDTMFLINGVLQQVVSQGTAKRIGQALPSLQAAGKTGTTNDGRDAWFAGFTGQHLAVVWVGQDNNQPTPLTGSSGALPIWQGLFENLPSSPYKPVKPQDIVWEWVNENGELSASRCQNAVQLPFIKGSQPDRLDKCRDQGFLKRLFSW